MDSHRQRILNRMADAQRRLNRAPWSDAAFADLQTAAADLFQEDVARPARQREARRAHMAGQHADTPSIGTCPSCLAEYVTTRPTPGS